MAIKADRRTVKIEPTRMCVQGAHGIVFLSLSSKELEAFDLLVTCFAIAPIPSAGAVAGRVRFVRTCGRQAGDVKLVKTCYGQTAMGGTDGGRAVGNTPAMARWLRVIRSPTL